MTDTERIAAVLRKRGEVSPLDFDGSRPPIDGTMKPIKRMAARVKELRDEGWIIRTDTRDGMALYVLVQEPGKARVADPRGETDDERFQRTIPPVTDIIAEWESAA